jgi:hypothetical protein
MMIVSAPGWAGCSAAGASCGAGVAAGAAAGATGAAQADSTIDNRISSAMAFRISSLLLLLNVFGVYLIFDHLLTNSKASLFLQPA